MQWFKHDTNATMDYKIRKLIIKYGAIGYAVYFHCLELIAEGINENNITFELEHDSEIIADDLRIQGTAEQSGKELVEEIMRFMISLNLFEENNGHIFCFKLLKRLDTSMTSNRKFREIINKAKDQHDYHDTVMINHDNVMTNHDTIMQDKIRIDKIRKEENTYKDSCVPAYIPKIPEEDCNIFYQEVFDLINSHNSSCKKKIPISRDIISFRYKEGYQLANILQKESRETVIQALKNYLKVANSKTWKNGFSFNAFCNNYFEYIDENFDMTKYLDLPKDRAKLINDFIDQKFKEKLVFRIQTFIYHRSEWFEQGMPDGKELQQLVKKWEEEDEKNKINYGIVLADWEKNTA